MIHPSARIIKSGKVAQFWSSGKEIVDWGWLHLAQLLYVALPALVFKFIFCHQNQLLYILSLSNAKFTCINWWFALPRRVVLSSPTRARKIQNFLKRYPLSSTIVSLWRLYPTTEQTAHAVGIQLRSRYLKGEKGGRVAVKLDCKRLTLVVLSSQTNRQKAMGCYLGGCGPRVWEDSMSTAIQNATDQVTEPVNIADAYDLYRSLSTQLHSNLLLKD